MPRLVTKFKYLKPGAGGKSVGGYARYIATREGVEKMDDSHRHAPATQKQQVLIEKILRDFPDTKQSHEYRDYQQERTVGNASEFISMAMEEHLDAVANTKTYADYIATRPRAERFGSHGLFTDDGVEVQLSEVSKELNAYRGNVYTAILSLKREDAARLGFDNGSRWRDFLRGQTPILSENLKIPMNHYEIGKAVCQRTEKGAAVMASEYLNKQYPDAKGFSPRSLRRMRDFYRTYENYPSLLSRTMELGWIQNVVIMEAELTMELREWYMKAAKQFGWSKTELIANIAENAHENIVLAIENEVCYIVEQEEKQAVPKMEAPATIQTVIHKAIRRARKRWLIWKGGRRRCVIMPLIMGQKGLY